jgi:putative FmdB family regulatory protein
MPIYEYRCKACDHETEALQKMSDKPLRKCPECGRMQLQRLISAPSFRLKGAGWYETDFKSGKENKRNIAGDAPEQTSSEKASTEKSAEKKTDKKTDKKDKKEGSSSADSAKSTGKKSGGKDSSSAVA